MRGNPNARWTTDWLETLEGDRLRELSCALFSRMGYQVHSMDGPSDLDFELSQEAPMAPCVGLCCRAEAEGIDIPLLRKIDAAVSQKDHGFSLVAKNGEFRPEEKMFAHGRPLQLIDSEEFIKRLGQLPADQQDVVFKEFGPSPLPADQGSAQSAETGAGSTPDFIKKIENIPGFSNKKATPPSEPATESSPAPSDEPAPVPASSPELAGTEGGNPTPVNGLNLQQAIPSPPASTPNQPMPGPAPMAQSLQPLAQPESAPSSPVNPVSDPQTATPSASPARTPDPDPITAAGEASAHSAQSPAQAKVPASSPSASPEVPPAAPVSPPNVAQNPTQSLPAVLRPSSGDIEKASPPAAATSEPEPAPANPVPASATTSSSPFDNTGSATAPPAAPTHAAPPAPAPENGQDSSSSFPIPQSSTSPDQPPSFPENRMGPPPIPEEQDDDAPEVKPSRTGKRRVPAMAVVAVFLLLISVVGGFFAFKFFFSSKPQDVAVVPTPTQLQLPLIDEEKIENLSKELAERITELEQVTSGIEGREAAVKIVVEATRAHQAGIDFVELGNRNLLATIEAVVQGETIDDEEHPENGETFGSLFLGDVSHELVANYLVIEDGFLKFSMEERDPRLAVTPLDDSMSGEELLAKLGKLLNRQHVVGAQTNARRLADVAASATSSGLDFTAAGRRSIEKTIAAIVAGETVNNHVDTGGDVHFGLPNLSEKAQRDASDYLQFSQGDLVYVSDPLPSPKPAFNLIGKDLTYDLERAESIAGKAVAHVRGRIPSIESDAGDLAKEQEAILALTGEPQKVTFAAGSIAILLPRDFNFEMEDEDTILVTPKYSPNKDAIWLRVRFQSPEVIQGPDGELGIPRLRALAKSLGRPLEKIEDKIYYWKNDEVLEGDLLYWVTSRHVGFGNSIVHVADATARGMEDLPEVARLQKVLPGIIASLCETGEIRTEIKAVDAGDLTAPSPPKSPILSGRAVPR